MKTFECENCEIATGSQMEIEHFDQFGRCVQRQVEKVLEDGFESANIHAALNDLSLQWPYFLILLEDGGRDE